MKNMTLNQFVFAFAEKISRQAEENGISPSIVESALGEIGYEVPEFGVGCTFYTEAMMRDLPEGSVVYLGDPTNWHAFGLWVKESGGRYGTWRKVTGGCSHTMPPAAPGLTVVCLGEDRERVPWLDEPVTPDDEEKIAEFKRRAATVGWDYKQKYDWCGTFERCMSTAGVRMA